MQQEIKIGQLDCTVIGPYSHTEKPGLVVLLCHGFGASGTDLVPLAEEVRQAANLPKSKVTFIFPAAPLALESFGGFDGRAWWMINMQKLADMTGARDFSELRSSVPPGIIEARELLNETLDEIFHTTSLSWDRLIIGGFSQGAMLTTDTVLHSDHNPLALIQMSGTLICEHQWRNQIQDHQGLLVLQSHGTIDPVLPFEAAEWLRDLFKENGCHVDFEEFQGVHTIPMSILEKLCTLIQKNC